MAILRVTPLVLLILAGPELMGCSKAADDTSFTQASKGFEKELSPDQRKAVIKQLETETAGKP
jgi:hypothetical protein